MAFQKVTHLFLEALDCENNLIQNCFKLVHVWFEGGIQIEDFWRSKPQVELVDVDLDSFEEFLE